MTSLCCLKRSIDGDECEIVEKRQKSAERSYGMLALYGGVIQGLPVRNVWSYWIDYIINNQERYGFVAAVMMSLNGTVSAFTKDFVPAAAEVKALNRIFDGCDDTEMSFNRCTYVIKVRPEAGDVTEGGPPRLLAAFNGCRYLLVCRSLSKYLVCQTEGRRGEEWLKDVLSFLNRLGCRLIDKRY